MGVHRDVVKSIPYISEIIDHHPDTQEVVNTPLDPTGTMMYLETIYEQARKEGATITNILKLIKSAHYMGDTSRVGVDRLPCILTSDQKVEILNGLVGLTSHAIYQEMFYNVLNGYSLVDPNKRKQDGILTRNFFSTSGVNLSTDSIREIIRCYPCNQMVLYGLLVWNKHNHKDTEFKALLRKMDLSETDQIWVNISDELAELIRTCADLEYFKKVIDRFGYHVDPKSEDIRIPLNVFDITLMKYDSLRNVVSYNGHPRWMIELENTCVSEAFGDRTLVVPIGTVEEVNTLLVAIEHRYCKLLFNWNSPTDLILLWIFDSQQLPGDNSKGTSYIRVVPETSRYIHIEHIVEKFVVTGSI